MICVFTEQCFFLFSLSLFFLTEVFLLPKNSFLVWRTGHNHTNHATLFFLFACWIGLPLFSFAVAWVKHTTIPVSLYVKTHSQEHTASLLMAEICQFQLAKVHFFSKTKGQFPRYSFNTITGRYSCTFLNLWLLILQRIPGLGALKHFGRQLWNISLTACHGYFIQAHTTPHPTPLHYSDLCSFSSLI